MNLNHMPYVLPAEQLEAKEDGAAISFNVALKREFLSAQHVAQQLVRGQQIEPTGHSSSHHGSTYCISI